MIYKYRWSLKLLQCPILLPPLLPAERNSNLKVARDHSLILFLALALVFSSSYFEVTFAVNRRILWLIIFNRIVAHRILALKLLFAMSTTRHTRSMRLRAFQATRKSHLNNFRTKKWRHAAHTPPRLNHRLKCFYTVLRMLSSIGVLAAESTLILATVGRRNEGTYPSSKLHLSLGGAYWP